MMHWTLMTGGSGGGTTAAVGRGGGGGGRGLHSSTFQLNVSTFCGIRWVHVFPPVY
jgi:hypothetical protein